MTDDELADFMGGDDKDHPFALLHDELRQGGKGAYNAFVRNFLVNNFISDVWGDRVVRDVMEAAGDPAWDDPDAHDETLAAVRGEDAPEREAGLAAMARGDEARARGERPDPEDEALVERVFGERGTAMKEFARNLRKTLQDKYKSWVVTPATAIWNAFTDNGDMSMLQGETEPHPDANSPEPRTREERERARERGELEGPTQWGDEDQTEGQGSSEDDFKFPDSGEDKEFDEYMDRFEGRTFGYSTGDGPEREVPIGALIYYADKTNKPAVSVSIKDLEHNFEDTDTDEEIDSPEFRERAEKADLKYPIMAVRNEDGSLSVMDGMHRLWKAKNQGDDDIQVQVFDQSELGRMPEMEWEDEDESPEEGEAPSATTPAAAVIAFGGSLTKR